MLRTTKSIGVSHPGQSSPWYSTGRYHNLLSFRHIPHCACRHLVSICTQFNDCETHKLHQKSLWNLQRLAIPESGFVGPARTPRHAQYPVTDSGSSSTNRSCLATKRKRTSSTSCLQEEADRHHTAPTRATSGVQRCIQGG